MRERERVLWYCVCVCVQCGGVGVNCPVSNSYCSYLMPMIIWEPCLHLMTYTPLRCFYTAVSNSNAEYYINT